MKKPRFNLKTLVFVVTLATVLLGWWADHWRLVQKIEDLESPIESGSMVKPITLPSGWYRFNPRPDTSEQAEKKELTN